MATTTANRRKVFALPGVRKLRHRQPCFKCRALVPHVMGGPFPRPVCVDCAFAVLPVGKVTAGGR